MKERAIKVLIMIIIMKQTISHIFITLGVQGQKYIDELIEDNNVKDEKYYIIIESIKTE